MSRLYFGAFAAAALTLAALASRADVVQSTPVALDPGTGSMTAFDQPNCKGNSIVLNSDGTCSNPNFIVQSMSMMGQCQNVTMPTPCGP